MLFGPLALIVGGGVLWWLAERRLESGLRTETWQDEELKPLRRVVNRSGFKLIGLLPFAIWLILLVANYRGGLGGLSIIFIQPFLAIARVGALLNPKPTVVRQDWHEWKRFQSEHWGEGQVPGEEFLSS
jgi:hypothetical protein